MKHPESALQRECVKWFRLQYPHLRLCLWAVPNGGRRGKVEAAILKGEGVVPGVADLHLLYRGKLHCIEMKAGKGRQTESQKEWERAVCIQGAEYDVVRSFDEFKGLIEHIVTADAIRRWGLRCTTLAYRTKAN